MSAVAAAAAGVEPTGIGTADVVLAASIGGLVVAMTVVIPPRAVVVTAGATMLAALADPALMPVGLAAAGLAIGLAAERVRRPRYVQAVAGLFVAQALLRLNGGAFQGDTALLAGLVVTVLGLGALRALRSDQRRWALLAGFAVVLAGGAASAATGVAALGVRHDVDAAVDAVEAGLHAAREADQGRAVQQFEAAAALFADAEREVNVWWARAGRAVPVVSQNARALEELASVGHDLAVTAASAAAAADPESARLADGRIDLSAIRALERPLERTVEALQSARGRAGTVASPWLLGPLADAREELLERVDEGLPDARTALAATRVTPGIFGGEGPRRYFVAFVTPAEARPSGGIVGNYAELTVSDGRMEMTAFGRNTDLNRAGNPEARTLVGPPDYLARYGSLNIPRYWQDVTFSPDFPSVAQVIESLYPQSGGRTVDGVISVDPIALAELLELTGPVRIPELEEPLTADNARDVLLRDQYVRFGDLAERVDFLEHTAIAVFERLTTGSLPGPGRIAGVLGPVARQGHLKLHSVHAEEQAFYEQVGLAGEYPAVRGQFLGVASGTASQSKVDAFLRREIEYDAVVDPANGRTEALVTVTLHNDAPASGLPRYVIGGGYTPPGVNESYLAVYSPLRLVAAEVDGEPLDLVEETELGRWVASGYVTVPPGSSVTVRVRLAGVVAMRVEEGTTRVRLDVARQPLVAPDDVDVTIRFAPGWRDRATGRDEISRHLELTENTTVEAVLVR